MLNRDRQGLWQLSNNARILRHIIRYQPISRSQIAEELGCPSSLVTGATAALIQQGVVRQLGKAEKAEGGAPGRRRLALGIQPDAAYGIGVEIGTRHFRFCLTDLAGTVVRELCYAPSSAQISNVNQSILLGVRELMELDLVPAGKVVGVGVALPGHLNTQSGDMVTHSSLWRDFNVGVLENGLGLRVTAENNVRTMAYEKYLFDCPNCPEDFALLHVGAGIFCAAFRSGTLMEGGYTSGEIGHTILNPNGLRCECGKVGCLQTWASESWLLKKARLAYQAIPSSILRTLASDESEITLETLLQAYQMGDPFVVDELREALRYLSIAAANSAIVMGVQKLFLNSRMFQNELLRREFLSLLEAQLSFIDNVCDQDIEILPFQSSRAAVGASALAIDRLFICGR